MTAKGNVLRFSFIYIFLIILDKCFSNPIDEYRVVYQLGMAAFCCLLGDVLGIFLQPSTKKGE